VIFATGYRPNLDYLESLGALDAEGRVLHQHGVSPTVPGLYFVGLSNQRTYASATLRGVGPDAAVVVHHLTHHLAVPALKASAAGRRLFHGSNCCPAPQSPA
jgi:putative flavoprotein involved in K+ transport